jgi:metal-responsive CopG/Arc/MetJ family transcriptional regulator
MARRQVLVQLSDELLAAVDERAGQRRVSRSELVRSALQAYLGEGREADIDRQIVEGYRRIPPPQVDPWAEAAARRSIRDEPW